MVKMSKTFGSRPIMCFEVEKVIGVSNDGSYQVQWAPAWVSKFHLVGCEHLIQEFLQRQQQQQQEQEDQKQSQSQPQQYYHQQQQQQYHEEPQQQQHTQEQQKQQQQQQQQQQPLEIQETMLMSVKYEEDEEEPCDEITHFHSSIPSSSTTHNNNNIQLSPYVMNNDMNQPVFDTTLTDSTELVDESGLSSEVKQEDADDWSVFHLVDEESRTNSKKVKLLF